ncbi:hypothetical protein C2G38_2193334 [Gigaspora rosea]|uniref:Uncharacterized protein n=1 Tax=Gigaspora rosea TaxID=44941 RepID=A0A397UXU6_9GLOM|nr:hypothetical protein C2G38_2193334 [Gigaspora rosea]
MPRAPFSQGMKEFSTAGRGLANNNDFKIKWTKLLFEELEGYWKSLGSANSNEVMQSKDLKNDMLTSLIIANTERDVNYKKDVEEEIFPPMTDIESELIF